MTFAQAAALEKVAYCHLGGGAVLRYEPQSGQVRQLAHAATPVDWRQAPYVHGPVPEDGWSHLLGCGCSACGGSV